MLIPYLPQSSTNKSRNICTWPCKSVRLSCTYSLRDRLWCNTEQHNYTHCACSRGRGLTPQYVSLPSISALVCNDCQCQKPPTVHSEVRSPNAITANTTTLLATVSHLSHLHIPSPLLRVPVFTIIFQYCVCVQSYQLSVRIW